MRKEKMEYNQAVNKLDLTNLIVKQSGWMIIDLNQTKDITRIHLMRTRRPFHWTCGFGDFPGIATLEERSMCPPQF